MKAPQWFFPPCFCMYTVCQKRHGKYARLRQICYQKYPIVHIIARFWYAFSARFGQNIIDEHLYICSTKITNWFRSYLFFFQLSAGKWLYVRKVCPKVNDIILRLLLLHWCQCVLGWSCSSSVARLWAYQAKVQPVYFGSLKVIKYLS